MNTEGPAFPGTLLDWFAGQALVGFLVYPYASLCAQGIEKAAYDYAEAMLAERARREATGKDSLQVADHSGEANKMVEDHFPDATKMTNLVEQNRELVEKVKRLEEAGDAMHRYYDASSRFKCGEAREIKP